MENAAIHKLRVWARKPASVVALSAAVFIVANLAYFGLETLPAYHDRTTARTELDNATQRYEQAMRIPDPKRATDEEIEALLGEVPTRHYASDVIRKLLELERQSEVKISSLKVNNAKTMPQDALEQQIDSLSGESAAGGTTLPAADETGGTSGFVQADPYEITATGPLSHVFNFFDLLASNEAITNITSWSLSENKESDSGASDGTPSGEEIYDLTFSFTMYSVPSYEEALRGGPSASGGSSVEETMEEMRRRFPDIRDFQSIQAQEDTP